ncbi:GntR family transcriptional regulator [Pseudonocardia sp. DLS-67]
MMTAVRREAAPLRTQVVGLLRDAIVGAEYAPGERLTERVLCERFEVSRTVVREALRQLESEGLVEMVPQRGPVVATVSAADAVSLYEVREVLEALAGRAFAERATAAQKATLQRRLKSFEAALDRGDLRAVLAAKEGFYDALLDGAGNPVARATLRGIHARTSMLRGMTLQAPGRSDHTRRELRAITRAATSGDPAAAWAACEEHVRSAAVVAMEQLHAPAIQQNGPEQDGRKRA